MIYIYVYTHTDIHTSICPLFFNHIIHSIIINLLIYLFIYLSFFPLGIELIYVLIYLLIYSFTYLFKDLTHIFQCILKTTADFLFFQALQLFHGPLVDVALPDPQAMAKDTRNHGYPGEYPDRQVIIIDSHNRTRIYDV